MLKALVKKQLMEIFRGYFVNRKTNKLNSKGKLAAMFAGFALLMLLLAGVFFALSVVIGTPMVELGFDWLFFALMGALSVALGAFGSVFNTYSAMYMAKDNEMLLAMPIPPWKILTSRLVSVYALSLLYSGVVWIPAVVWYGVLGHPDALAVVFGILLIFIIALFVTVLSCALGWIVALISNRLKNKSIFTVILSLAFLGAYYALCFRMSDMLELLISNVGAVADVVQNWGNLLYQLGMAASGHWISMLIFSGITLVMAAVCFAVLTRTFTHIVLSGISSHTTKRVKMSYGASNVKSALLRRELARFTSSANYMLNCGLGIVLMPVLAVIAVINQEKMSAVHLLLPMMLENGEELLPLAIVLVLGMIVSINVISTPSVSLQGKSLWVIRTMPVRGADVLHAKIRLHVLLNLPSVWISVALLGKALQLDGASIAAAAAVLTAYTIVTAQLGLMIGLLRPSLNWTSEQMVIKQSMNTLFSMLAGIIVLAVTGFGGFYVRGWMPMTAVLLLFAAVETVAALILNRWVNTSGGRAFEAL